MKLYIINTTGIKRVKIPSAEMKGKNATGRRLSQRMVMMPAIMLLGLVLPFLLIRTAFLVLESAALCSSSIGCMTWRFFGEADALLREELMGTLLEAADSSNYDGGGRTVEDSNSEAVTFKDLVKDMASNRKDIKAFAFKTRNMISKMEHIVKAAKLQESIYWHMAAHSLPKSLNCLSLKLAEEYAVNAFARSHLSVPQYVDRLTDPSYHHVVLLTDNVLAASVVILSTIKTSSNAQKLVFHVVTDKKTYTSMHAWFAVNTIDSAVVEVKGLHQFDWSHEVNVGVKEMIDIHHKIRNHKYRELKKEDFDNREGHNHKLDVLSDSCISLLSHLRMYLPELFPDQNRVVLLEDDVVVQRDLSSLWDMDLNQKVVGAVVDSLGGIDRCPGRKYKDYFNFTDQIISSNLDQDHCAWLYGMNVFDLNRWRDTNITAVYHHWLKHNRDSGFTLWHPGALPPALIAFGDHVHRLDPTWHLAGLGYRYSRIDRHELKGAAVIHFSGPAKPWLEIGSPEVRGLWNTHVNSSNEFIRECGVACVSHC